MYYLIGIYLLLKIISFIIFKIRSLKGKIKYKENKQIKLLLEQNLPKSSSSVMVNGFRKNYLKKLQFKI